MTRQQKITGMVAELTANLIEALDALNTAMVYGYQPTQDELVRLKAKFETITNRSGKVQN